MALTRFLVFPIGGFAMVLACTSRPQQERALDGGPSDDAWGGGDEEAGGEAGAVGCPGDETDVAPTVPGNPDAGEALAPLLGTWTLVGTEQYICSTDASDSLPVAGTMTLWPGPGATEAGTVDLLFDGGLGCSLAMSVTGGVATLTWAPQACGVPGKPIDRVYTSVEIAKPSLFPGWLRIEETFTDPSGCAFLVQGYMVP
ncbi:MAG TPA: hypothetical protein VEK07_03190 [Polyangiaceae bacterium]|nr:hypothetical protein [Polyangiaceae bacterium]